MNPPTWLDERGRPRPKQPCPLRRSPVDGEGLSPVHYSIT
jgi:hypothetical protein